MNEDDLQSPGHVRVRTILRVGGPAIAVVGLLFTVAGFGSVLGGFDAWRYVWLAFVGIPMLFVGIVMSNLGYMGAIQRYLAEETAPVAKDMANYMGQNVQPGVKAVAKAVTEGVIEAQNEQTK